MKVVAVAVVATLFVLPLCVVGQITESVEDCAPLPPGAREERTPGYFCDDSTVFCGTSWDGDALVCDGGVCVPDAVGGPGSLCGSGLDGCTAGLECASAGDGKERCLRRLAAGEECSGSWENAPPLTWFTTCPPPPYNCGQNTNVCEIKVERSVGETCVNGWDCVGWEDDSVLCESENTFPPTVRKGSFCYAQVGLGDACGEETFRRCHWTLDDGRNLACTDGTCVVLNFKRLGEPCGEGQLPCLEGLDCVVQAGVQFCVTFSQGEGEECEPNSQLVRDGGLTLTDTFCRKDLKCVAVPCVADGIEFDGCRGQEGFCRAE